MSDEGVEIRCLDEVSRWRGDELTPARMGQSSSFWVTPSCPGNALPRVRKSPIPNLFCLPSISCAGATSSFLPHPSSGPFPQQTTRELPLSPAALFPPSSQCLEPASLDPQPSPFQMSDWAEALLGRIPQVLGFSELWVPSPSPSPMPFGQSWGLQVVAGVEERRGATQKELSKMG